MQSQEPFLANAKLFVPHPDARMASGTPDLTYQLPCIADVRSISDVRYIPSGVLQGRPYLVVTTKDGVERKLYGYRLEEAALKQVASQVRKLLEERRLELN